MILQSIKETGLEKIRDNLRNSKIKDIIDGYDDKIINPMIKELLYVFLVRRRKKLWIYIMEKRRWNNE